MLRKISVGAIVAFASCTTYDPSLLTGEGNHAGGGANGGSDGVSGDAGASSATGGLTSGGGAGRGGTGQGATPGGGDGGTASGGEPGGAAGSEGGVTDPAAGGMAGTSDAGDGGDAGGAVASGGAATGGEGGSAGGTSEGGAAGAGLGGSTGEGGTPVIAGAAGEGGSAGEAGETCAGQYGCAKLSVPLEALDDRTLFSLDLGADTDFSDAVITYRVYNVTGTGGRIWAYVQHGGTPDFNLIYGGSEELADLDGWVDVTFDVAAADPGFPFDKSVIRRVGVEILANGSGPWASPTVVYLDSITVTTGPSVGPWTFDEVSSVSSAASPAAADVLWMSVNASEVVAGSTLEWIP